MDKMYSKVLRTLREQHAWTQTEVATKIQLSQRAYAHYEKGESEPGIETMIRLADLYGVSLDYLVGRYVAR